MAATWSYGDYTHAAGSVAFEGISRSFIDSPNGKHKILRVQIMGKGKLVSQAISGTAEDVWGQLATLEHAYLYGGGSARLVSDLGTLLFLLDSTTALGGVRCFNPISHGEIMGAEGTTYIRYKFGLQADYYVASLQDVLDFSETVTFSDTEGGPLKVERVPITGYPIIQNVSERSFFRATQQGHIVTVAPFPPPMPPLFPGYLRGVDGASAISKSSPKMYLGVPLDYETKWAYQFVSINPLVNIPNIVG